MKQPASLRPRSRRVCQKILVSIDRYQELLAHPRTVESSSDSMALEPPLPERFPMSGRSARPTMTKRSERRLENRNSNELRRQWNLKNKPQAPQVWLFKGNSVEAIAAITHWQATHKSTCDRVGQSPTFGSSPMDRKSRAQPEPVHHSGHEFLHDSSQQSVGVSRRIKRNAPPSK